MARINFGAFPQYTLPIMFDFPMNGFLYPVAYSTRLVPKITISVVWISFFRWQPQCAASQKVSNSWPWTNIHAVFKDQENKIPLDNSSCFVFGQVFLSCWELLLILNFGDVVLLERKRKRSRWVRRWAESRRSWERGKNIIKTQSTGNFLNQNANGA